MYKPSILLNFIALKSGGGVQVGLDFLSNIKNSTEFEWHLVVTEGTAFDDISTECGVKSIHRVRSGLIGRAFAEFTSAGKIVSETKPKIVLTLFGPGFLCIRNPQIKTISGCAYSNLFYPEIDFWNNCGFFLKNLNRFIDVFRLFLTKNADMVVFETDDIKERAISLRKFSLDRVCVVMPSVSSKISLKNIKATPLLDKARETCGFKAVMISYYRYHKNIDLLPHVLRYIEDTYNIKNIYFLLTIEPNHPGTVALYKLACELNVQDRIVNSGPIPAELCSELYACADMSILPSTLESFSNNISESWSSSVPLLITDMSWARSICGDAAIYAKHRDISDISEKILSLYQNENARNALVELGKKRLSEYPESEERFLRYVDIINKTLNHKGNGPNVS